MELGECRPKVLYSRRISQGMSDKPSFDASLSLEHAVRIPIFVEDPETAIYFESLFPELATQYYFDVASGFFGVASRLQSHKEKHPESVAFGIRDRDYGQDESSKWKDVEQFNLSLRRFEIENYCLDWEALAHYSQERLSIALKPETIRMFAVEYAHDIIYAVAYNAMSWQSDSRFCKMLPSAVKIYAKPYSRLSELERTKTITTLQEAESLFDATDFSQFLINGGNVQTALTETRRQIALLSERYLADLGAMDDVWIWTFPGKEILRAICAEFFNMGSDNQSVIRFVAEWQSKAGVPSDLKELKDCIRRKSGL